MDDKDLEIERLRMALETKTKTKTHAEEDPREAELLRLRMALETKTKLKTATLTEDPKDAELRKLREALETKTKLKTATATSVEDSKDAELKRLREALETKTRIGTVTDSRDAEISKLKEALETKTKTKTKEVDPLDAELEKLRAEMRKTELATSAMSSTVNLKKKEAELKKNEAIRKIAEKADKATEVNLCFVIDCTGSMQSWIDEAKRIALDIDSSIRKWYPTLKIHVGFVGYRDLSDSVRFEVLDFTPDANLLRRKLESVVATGGRDIPEDVVGGLGKAINLSWNLTTRILIHIADAPGHGSKYHNCEDDYPQGDPSGVTIEDQLEKLAAMDVNYTFIKINTVTDIMTGLMKTAYADKNNCGLVEFTVANLGDHVTKLLPTVTKTVADSIIRTKTAVKF